jgi:arabinofuranosyltransferase
MLIAAGALALGRDPLAVVRVAAVASIAASLVVLWRLGRAVSGSRARANLSVLLLAALPGLAYWTMSGLETASVVLVSLLYLLAFTRDRTAERLPWRTALAADLVLLSRPDGVLLVALAALPLLWVTPRPRGRWLAQAAALAAPVAFLYFGWKVVVFHRLMPNTVAAKFHLLQGLSMSTGFLAFSLPLLALGLYGLGRGAPLWRHQVLVLAFGYMAALANAAAQVGHYHRFFLPVLAPVLALVTLLPAGAEHSRFRGVVLALAMVVLLSPLPEMSIYAHHEAEGWNRAHVTVGRMLRRYFAATDVLAASDCGAVPYYSGMRTVDMWGLADQRIAEHGFDAGYVMDTRPAVIILHSLERDRFSGRESYDRELYPVMERSGRYRLVGRWEFFGYWLWVYSDRAVPVTDPAATPR